MKGQDLFRHLADAAHQHPGEAALHGIRHPFAQGLRLQPGEPVALAVAGDLRRCRQFVEGPCQKQFESGLAVVLGDVQAAAGLSPRITWKCFQNFSRRPCSAASSFSLLLSSAVCVGLAKWPA